MNDTSKKSFNFKRMLCVTSGDETIHHLDHLAAIAFLFQIPLLSDTTKLYEATQKYYPQVKPLYIDHHQAILELLALNYEGAFATVANYRKDLAPLIEMFYGKKFEFWYCPHGNSDKTLKHFLAQENALVYGNQMQQRLIQEGYAKNLKSIVKTGNVRLPFYQTHEDWYDNLAQQEIFSQFAKKQTTILYAPTWHDPELSSSFFESAVPLIENLPDSYNLIVKIHPWLNQHQPGFVNLIQEKYRKRENIVILSQHPLIFPILKRVDLYVGDFSSIGYDFLFYDRPMFFFSSEKKIHKRENDSLLHSCGTLIPKSAYKNIFSFIEKHVKHDHLFSSQRIALFQDAFGPVQTLESIRQSLLNDAALTNS